MATPKKQSPKPKAATPKKVSEEDAYIAETEKRFAAGNTAQARAYTGPKVITAEARRRSESRQAVNAAAKKGLKGRRSGIDRMIDNF